MWRASSRSLPPELLDEIRRFPHIARRNHAPTRADQKPGAEAMETPATAIIVSLPSELRDEVQGFRPMTLRKTGNLSPKATHFFSLPAELRNQIYSYVLVCPHRLRSKGELKRHEIRNLNQTTDFQTRKDSQIFPNTAFLATCRKIINEALPIFYKKNRFHYSIPPHYTPSAGHLQLYLPRPLALHFEFLQHLSIDFAHTWPGSFTSFTHHGSGSVDDTIANHILNISAKCPSLRSFTLHILADAGFMAVVDMAINNSHSATAFALQRLQVREHMSVVACGDRNAFGVLRNAVQRGWGGEPEVHYMRWPEISIAKWQLQEVSGVGAYYDRCDLVREWHFWPLGSERLRRGYWKGMWMGFVGGFGKR